MQRNIVNSKIETAKKEYIRKVLNENTKNPRKFWKIINQLLKGSGLPNETAQFINPVNSEPVPFGDEADFLNNYFCNIVDRLDLDNNFDNTMSQNIDTDLEGMYGHIVNTFDICDDLITSGELNLIVSSIDLNKGSGIPGIMTFICRDIMKNLSNEIVHLFNCSILNGIFPTEWAKGTITVIPKSGKLTDPTNWRPITQTPVFAKVFEKLIYRRIIIYIEENDILSKYQYGFRSQRSTQEAVFDLTKFIYTGLNNRKVIPAVCLDVCKAFDCINHDLLLRKMCKIGFCDNTIRRFKSYLTRTQSVKFKETLSTPMNVRTGIGQGTILGPLIFIFYINDIIMSVGNFKINMYADDCILFKSGNNWNRMVGNVQSDLDNVNLWCQRNKLKLSDTKSKVLIFGSSDRLKRIDYTQTVHIGNTYLEFVRKYKYLGVTLDQHMDLTDLISDVKKCFIVFV